MDVRLLTGRYKGQIREASPAAARAMLADGRAERAYAQIDGPAPAAVAAEPPAVPVATADAQISAAQQPAPPTRRRRRR